MSRSEKWLESRGYTVVGERTWALGRVTVRRVQFLSPASETAPEPIQPLAAADIPF